MKALANLSASNPITVRFFNADTVSHRIHGDKPTQGFAHGATDIPPGAFDPLERQVNAVDTYDFYPHDLGTNAQIVGRLIVQ